MSLPYADEVNYFKTGQRDPDAWMEQAKREILAIDGGIYGEGYGCDVTGRAAYMLEFGLDAERFRVLWPVLPVRNAKDERAARIQAATMLYHDIKAKVVAAKVHGARAAFFQYLMLPDGRTATQLAAPELTAHYPKLLTGGER